VPSISCPTDGARCPRLCLAENYEYNAARRELELPEAGEQGVPPRQRATFLRWRALAEARLANRDAATEPLKEARELDPHDADFRFVATRVKELLDTPQSPMRH
jgi:hypothetical protein